MSNIAFTQNGEIFRIAKRGEGTIHTELPTATYEVMFHPEKGFWLERIANMELNTPTYGEDMSAFVNRCMRSFDANKDNLGVMLVGRKGSGKTRTLKMLACKSIEMIMPVINVTQAFSGPYFNEWLGQIEQPVMLAFDEFDKTYAPTEKEAADGGQSNPRSQDGILALLQGTVSGGKKFFVFTANSSAGISAYLKNRPGRVRYTKVHEGLSQATIVDYANKHLANITEEKLAGLLGVSRLASDFSFDMLQAIVNEMNLFKEDAYKAAEMMVTELRYQGDNYLVRIHKDGELVTRLVAEFSRVGTPDFVANIRHMPVKDGTYEGMITISLGKENFVSWGESLVDAIYEKDGFTYNFLLVPPMDEGAPRTLLFAPQTPRQMEVEEVQKEYADIMRAASERWAEQRKAKKAANPGAVDTEVSFFGGKSANSSISGAHATPENLVSQMLSIQRQHVDAMPGDPPMEVSFTIESNPNNPSGSQ